MRILLFTFLLLSSFTASADENIYKWTGANDELCTAIFPSGATEKVDRKQCLLKAPIKYAWNDEAQKKCAAYTPNNIFVAFTEESNCKEGVKLECSPTLDTPETKLRTMIDGVLLKIIPEVLALKDGEAVPEKILKEKDSRLVAASLIERLSRIEKKPAEDDNKNLYDFYNDSEIQMAFFDKNFESIRKSCFRNQFQTNSTNGADDREMRQETEGILIGTPINGNLESPSDISHQLRPKYAYFVPTKPMLKGKGHEYGTNYGNIHAVFKDELKDRSTFTTADSLGSTEKAQLINSKQNYRKIRNNEDKYWEAQIWGNVCFNDVAHFLINCPTQPIPSAGMMDANPSSKKITAETLEKMKETGIPIYQCVKEKRGVNEVYTKGQLLVSENSSKRKNDEAKVDLNSNFPEKRIDSATSFEKAMREAKERYEDFLKSPNYLIERAKFELQEAYDKSPEGIAALRASIDKRLAEEKEAEDEYSKEDSTDKVMQVLDPYATVKYKEQAAEEEAKRTETDGILPGTFSAKAAYEAHLAKARAFQANPDDPKAKEEYKKSLEEREKGALK